jgi:hypothetical protein
MRTPILIAVVSCMLSIVCTPPRLDAKNCSVYISTPTDGNYGGDVYPNSGKMTAQSINSAFSKKITRVKTSSEIETYESGLKNARAQNFSYFLWPKVLHWEDRVTEWSGKPDRIEIKLVLIRVDDAKTIDSIIITGSSKWATSGGDRPQDLLQQPVSNYVFSLFE